MLKKMIRVGSQLVQGATAALILGQIVGHYVSEKDVPKVLAKLKEQGHDLLKETAPGVLKAASDLSKFSVNSYEYTLDLIKHLAREQPIMHIEKDKHISRYDQLVPEPPLPDYTIGKQKARGDIDASSEAYKKFDKEQFQHAQWLEARDRWTHSHPQGETVKEIIAVHEKDLPDYPVAQQVKEYLDDPYWSLDAIRARRDAEPAPVAEIKAEGGTKKRRETAWTKFVKDYAKKHKLTFFQALKPAHVAYKNKSGKGGGYFSELAKKHNVILR